MLYDSFILARICKYMLLLSFYNKGQHVTTLIYKYGYECYLSLLSILLLISFYKWYYLSGSNHFDHQYSSPL